LCEATCGLTITLDDDEVTAIRGDPVDVFSHGFLCPKGVALKELHDGPARIRTTLIRQADGSFATASSARRSRKSMGDCPRSSLPTATPSRRTSATRMPTWSRTGSMARRC
jgi:hypothetical protein